MSKDIQDILAVPADICVLIEDRFDVLRGLVGCSGDLESGCLEPFESNEYYKACVLDVSTTYYTTRIQVRSFDKLDIYLEWQSQSNHQHPSALFLCVDMNKSENDLKDFLDKAKTLDLDEIDTHVSLHIMQLIVLFDVFSLYYYLVNCLVWQTMWIIQRLNLFKTLLTINISKL